MNENNINVATNSSAATFLGHPRGLLTLFFTEMWERFSYYGMRALLVLFLVDSVSHGGFGLTDETAYAIYGVYTAAVFFMSLPGGWLADRVMGAQNAIWCGGIIIMAGHVILGLAGSPQTFYFGLLAVVIGTGLLKPNIGAIVAELYPEGGGRRDAGYTIYYFGVNLGATIGQIIAPWLAVTVGWHAGFFSAAVGMALGLVQFKWMRKHLHGAGAKPYKALSEQGGSSLGKLALVTIAILTVVAAPVMFGVIPFEPVPIRYYFGAIIGVLALASFVYLLWFAGLDAVHRRGVVLIFILFVASTVFWAGFEQVGSSLNLFAERYTDRMIDGLNFEIPAGWFQSVNTILILICAPLLAALWLALSKRNRDFSSQTKMAIGLIFLAAGFLVMSGAAYYIAAGAKVSPNWLIATFVFHTLGELCLSPIGMSSFSKLVPSRLVGLILGLWFLSISLGSLLASFIAATFDKDNLTAMSGQYMKVVLFAAIPGILLLLLAKPLQKLAGGVR
jgi:proton-dependent oligopeptide transporter, POT family